MKGWNTRNEFLILISSIFEKSAMTSRYFNRKPIFFKVIVISSKHFYTPWKLSIYSGFNQILEFKNSNVLYASQLLPALSIAKEQENMNTLLFTKAILNIMLKNCYHSFN